MSAEEDEADPFKLVMKAIEASQLGSEDRYLASVLAAWINYLEKTRDIDIALGALRARLDLIMASDTEV